MLLGIGAFGWGAPPLGGVLLLSSSILRHAPSIVVSSHLS